MPAGSSATSIALAALVPLRLALQTFFTWASASAMMRRLRDLDNLSITNSTTAMSSLRNGTVVAEPSNAEQRTSKHFCDAAADVVFQSSDGVLFRVYRSRLEANTGGFAPAKIPTLDEVVVLSEPAEVLELLFQFTHPSRQPSVLNLEFDLLFALAEAAEKYEVYGAMNTCNIRMHYVVEQKPMEILNYALKHGYTDLADKAAPVTVSAPSALTLAAQILTVPGALVAWVNYYAQWDRLARDSLDLIPKSSKHGSHPNAWASITDQHIRKVVLDPRRFEIDSISCNQSIFILKLSQHSTFPMRSRHSVKCVFECDLPDGACNWSGQNDVKADAYVERDGQGSFIDASMNIDYYDTPHLATTETTSTMTSSTCIRLEDSKLLSPQDNDVHRAFVTKMKMYSRSTEVLWSNDSLQGRDRRLLLFFPLRPDHVDLWHMQMRRDDNGDDSYGQ
ncbi:uncharacterized protein LACBIDRAFT_295590 [Laccaria bicolor S238N-H82]|uniref:Predicted protein n=1 Tax=Laccaria bicolor (strain S238N-H82 / ATCC MYA-4686) TaxID=486041 RepID=B0DVF0_LACBS|nr:uncharacterized protein LACBIDRAFT_295590 [Laccaria bicolor S238N-H82]EDR01410.1 predicted protein [Laccaria bicolor S238N-H82]|eukprot:XP_001887955.1 predicted protein [Laccaria bicolor S238N-H82]